MRVCLVSPFDPAPPPRGDEARAHVGGVERVLERFAAELARRGHEVTLLCSAPEPGLAARDDGVRVVRARRAGTLLRAPLAMLQRHLPRDADLVHVPATYPFTTVPVLRAAKRRGVPCVLDFHFEPHPGTPFGRVAAAAWRAAGPRAYRAADAVLVRSLGYARCAPSLRGVAERRWRVVPNGVDADRFLPGPAEPVPRSVLVVGRLVPYKGVEVLLRAAAVMPEPPVLMVAGDGPLRPRLEALARGLGVRATFLGRVPEALLPRLYRSAALTALPSVNRQEAFGIALIESMACGTPVVASRLPGVAEVASLGGLLAEPGDPASLAAALELALEPDALPRGRVLAERVRARYAWPVVAERLLAAYAAALGVEPPPPRRAEPGPPPAGARVAGLPEVRDPARPRSHPVL